MRRPVDTLTVALANKQQEIPPRTALYHVDTFLSSYCCLFITWWQARIEENEGTREREAYVIEHIRCNPNTTTHTDRKVRSHAEDIHLSVPRERVGGLHCLNGGCRWESYNRMLECCWEKSLEDRFAILSQCLLDLCKSAQIGIRNIFK